MRIAVDCNVEIDNLVLVTIFASRKQLLNRFERKVHLGAAHVVVCLDTETEQLC